ncbi:MAG: hypothetical protein HYY61_04330 [Deltaproteobacteria bacterium]|nr:hypothetical protein [Deltaproteobacteria bacterium]
MVILNLFQTRYRIPQRGIRARARTRSLASLEPCPLVLRDGLQKIKNYHCLKYAIICFILIASLLSPLWAQEQAFLKWVDVQIEKNQKNEIQMRPFERAKTFLNGPQDSPLEKKVTVEPTGDFIYTEITEPFEGDYKKAVRLYWDITTGKQKPSLFIESGAGRDEKIISLHSIDDGVQFISDRVYQSSLAFNSRATIHLRRFDVESKRLVIVINEVVKDWGAELAKKKVKRMAKSYYPIFCDLNIDVYQEAEPNKFWYHSYALYQGQGMKSTNTSLNMAKKVGDVFSFGMLDKGLKVKLTSEAVKIWEKRRKAFQDLISKDPKRAGN